MATANARAALIAAVILSSAVKAPEGARDLAFRR
jgi:hypothetical protein